MKLRILSSLLFVFAITVFMPAAASAKAPDDVNAFPNTYINTGNDLDDLLGVAATQIGYYRAANTPTKYGVWYGYSSDAWCAMFVSWCADQAGIPADVIKPFCRCRTEAAWFQNIGRWAEPSGYAPKAGDIIFYHYNGSVINHVGIVTSSDDRYVYTVEGNHNNSVEATLHELNDPAIAGYGLPSYRALMKSYNGDPVYRFYNPRSGEHFYTSITSEKTSLINTSKVWRYEGIAWVESGNEQPVYRLYNPVADDHHYTVSIAEKDMLLNAGWKYEGVSWVTSGSGNPIYRLYNPNATAGAHHYTASATERDMLIGVGWRYEGVAWYGK
ncbi:MAG: CHAP domain-containing protein [Lachnospiraceae bacterium]|nr:CHAP domain-containing protein [Lachnospiraceae bacterium]